MGSDRIKFSNSTVAAIRFENYRKSIPPGRRYFYLRDAMLPAFALRVCISSKTYYVIKWVKGKTRFIKIGTHGAITPDQARRKAMILVGQMGNGADPVADRNNEKAKAHARGMTLGRLVEEYFSAKKRMKQRTAHQAQRCLSHYFDNPAFPALRWMDKPVAEITRHRFLEAYSAIGKNSPSQAEKVRRNLHAVCNYAIHVYEGSILTTNPAYIKKDLRHQVRPRELRVALPHLYAFHDGLQTLNSGYGEVVRDYLLFTLIHGLRREESAAISRTDIDFDTETFTIFQTKNRHPHILPITSYAREIIARRLKDGGNLLFGSHGGNLRLREPRKQAAKVMEHMESVIFPGTPLPPKQAGYYVKRLGLPRSYFTIHSLRKTFSDVARAEVGSDMASRLMNHRSGQGGAEVTKEWYFGPEDVKVLLAAMEKIHARFRMIFSRNPLSGRQQELLP